MTPMVPAARLSLYRVPMACAASSITGTFTITKVADATGRLVYVTPSPLPFTGTFRLPFAISPTGSAVKSDKTQAAYYLADDRQTLIPVEWHQLSMGFPTVRLEVNFSH